MATLDPKDGDNNGEQPYIGEEHRNKVINTLPLMKQFTIRQHLKNADSLSREQAIEFLKEAIVQLAHKDKIFAEMMKSGM